MLASVVLAVLTLSASATAAVEANPDRTVTFTLTAPGADAVSVVGEGGPFFGTVPMAKDAEGVWSVTIGPLAPNWYGYRYSVDGLLIPDPENRDVYIGKGDVPPESTSQQSYVFVPGPEADFMADRDVPHGAVSTERYTSAVTHTQRRMTVYTPPGYGHGRKRYPVLYLQHGGGDNETAWIVKGRANLILDNLIADGRVRPMIVVMPSGNLGQFAPGPADDLFPAELVDNVVPTVQRRYRAARSPRERAFAGLSLGGLQAISVLLDRPGAFRYIGIFSSGLFPNVIADLEQSHPELLNGRRVNRLTDLVWDTNGGPTDIAYQNDVATRALFDRHGIDYVYTGPGTGGHTWDPWRRNLRDFAQLLFRRPAARPSGSAHARK
jgi:enterochelin esterase family protein